MASAGLGVPVKLLHESLGHIITVELKTGAMYRGKLAEAEDNLNISLKDITVTGRDGRVSQLDQVYIRGSMVQTSGSECHEGSGYWYGARTGYYHARKRSSWTGGCSNTVARHKTVKVWLDIVVVSSPIAFDPLLHWFLLWSSLLSRARVYIALEVGFERFPGIWVELELVTGGGSCCTLQQLKLALLFSGEWYWCGTRECGECTEDAMHWKSSSSGCHTRRSPFFAMSKSNKAIRAANRACDACRRRKTRCDGPKQANNICTNCRSTSKQCTYLYVTALEDRLEQLQDLLHQVRPDADFDSELGPPVTRGSWKEDGRGTASSSRHQQSPPQTSLQFSSHLALNSHWGHENSDSDDSDDLESSDSENLADVIRGDLRKLTSTAGDPDVESISSFHGKSSLWEKKWEGFAGHEFMASIITEFPPDPLAAELINLYFVHINSQLPLLHRPTFEHQFRDKVHHRHRWFACVCFAVFAVASRWSNDPLVLPRDCKHTSTGGLDWSSAGWYYYSVAMEIHRSRQSVLSSACLEEVQSFSLLACYLRGTANHPSAGWIFVSIGLRKAQDVGAHRKKVYSDKPNVEEELWKRALRFWDELALWAKKSTIFALSEAVLLRVVSFDLDPCLEVNDEFWEDCDHPFQQPSNVPCRITYFNLWLRLSQIVTFTVKTILGRIAKVRTDEVIAQLTLALQDWIHSLPDYLRWSPHIEDAEFANQSACLTTTYYLAEMLIYRAFIPPVQTSTSPGPPIPGLNSPIPALTYCINAARSITRIVEVQFARGWTNVQLLISVCQLAATILTLAVWDAKAKAQTFEDVKPPIGTLMEDIGILLGTLEAVEGRWESVTNMM
ncbi:hypothetical protein C8F01DRAFT_1076366 [Mycena amicta]|nr:hypothetical protein C8F01DRAFT_1076366 [Mycena amicta]